MHFQKIIFTLIYILLSANSLFSQTSITNKGKILNNKELVEDYNVLYSALINYHPQPFLYINKQELLESFEEQKKNFPDSLSELDFFIYTQELISQIKCGHTFSEPSKEWFKNVTGKNIQLPFNIKIIDDRVYISNITQDTFPFKIYDEILSINDIPIQDILKKMYDIQSRDGYTLSFCKALVEKRFRIYIIYILGTQSEYFIEYQTKEGEVKKQIVSACNKKIESTNEIKVLENFKIKFENSWSTFSFDSISNIAYLKINNFSDRKNYKKYYESIFKFLSQKQEVKLIIDLRNNPGGFFMNGNKFLTYLTPKKFDLSFQKPKKEIKKINTSLLKNGQN